MYLKKLKTIWIFFVDSSLVVDFRNIFAPNLLVPEGQSHLSVRTLQQAKYLLMLQQLANASRNPCCLEMLGASAPCPSLGHETNILTQVGLNSFQACSNPSGPETR